TLDFTFNDFSYESIGATTVTGKGVADGHTLFLQSTRAEKHGGTMGIEGTFPEGSGGQSRITGNFHRWPIEDALARAGAPAGAAVRVSGRAEYRPAPDADAGEADLSLAEATLGDMTFTEGSFRASLRGSRAEVSHLSLEGPRARVFASGSYDFSTGALVGDLKGSRIDATLAGGWLRGWPLAGHAAVDVHTETGEDGPCWKAQLAPEGDLTLSGRPLTSIRLQADGNGTRARFEGAFGAFAQFSGSIALAPPHEGEGHIELRDVPIGSLLSLSRPDLAAQVGGEIGGEIDWSGPVDDISRIRARAVLGQLRMALGPETLQALEPARLSLEEARVRFEGLELQA
ncbi:MAG: hypothetical protein ACREDF_06555, partial [Thermoplasmata archaeon]